MVSNALAPLGLQSGGEGPPRVLLAMESIRVLDSDRGQGGHGDPAFLWRGHIRPGLLVFRLLSHLFFFQGFQGKTGPPGPPGVVGPQVCLPLERVDPDLVLCTILSLSGPGVWGLELWC